MSAAAETALTALGPATIHMLEERGGVGKIIAYLRHDPNRFLTTILIISSSSLIVASSMATLLFTSILPAPWGELLATVGISILVLLVAELTPKNIAVRKPTRVAMVIARPVRFFEFILRPVNVSAGAVVGALMRLLGQGGGSTTVPVVTEEDVRSTLTLAEQSEGLTEEETDRIEGVLDLDKITAGEVMKPRVDIVAVPVETPLMEALDVVVREGHSRIPVYEESIDDIVGILYDKDLLRYIRENELDVSLRDVAREAIFVPEAKRADDLLRDFQKRKVHMAIVVDEYGGTAGLVTIEDLLEEIVGEIQDEYDVEEPLFEKRSEDEWIFDAMLRIEEVNEEMGLELVADNGVETLGGYVFERLGEVPEVGDCIQTDHVTLEVVEVEGKRIKKVRITRTTPPQAAPAEE
jgi:CBS domain containing-hemolysin-like protein